MSIQQRMLKFITRLNWILLFIAGYLAAIFGSAMFAAGVITGGLIVTVNFHLLARTLRKALIPPFKTSQSKVLVKYYIRFLLSGILIFILMASGLVDPIGLVLGLSIVVTSISIAAVCESTKLIFFKEAV